MTVKVSFFFFFYAGTVSVETDFEVVKKLYFCVMIGGIIVLVSS